MLQTQIDFFQEKQSISKLQNEIYHIDLTDGLRGIGNTKFDCIMADPPYNLGYDFGNASDSVSFRVWLATTQEQIRLLKSHLKPSGTMFVFGRLENLQYVATKCFEIGEYRYLIWHYDNNVAPNAKHWLHSYDAIICYNPDKEKRIFNQDDVRKPYQAVQDLTPRFKPNTPTSRFYNPKKPKKMLMTYKEQGSMPLDLFKFNGGNVTADEKIIYCKTCDRFPYSQDRYTHINAQHKVISHPTQKPLALITMLFQSCIPKDRTPEVLIPYSGSGIDTLAAYKLRCNSIAYEVNEDYALMAKNYIAKIKKEEEESLW